MYREDWIPDRVGNDRQNAGMARKKQEWQGKSRNGNLSWLAAAADTSFVL
jgi:hypothetical protein